MAEEPRLRKARRGSLFAQSSFIQSSGLSGAWPAHYFFAAAKADRNARTFVTLALDTPSKEPRMRQVAIAMILPLLISPAFAASPPLAAGKPAGIKQAQDRDYSTPLIVMGAAAVGIGIALAVSGDGNAPIPAPPTTTTTTTTGTGP